jgi:hypothetical protein
MEKQMQKSTLEYLDDYLVEKGVGDVARKVGRGIKTGASKVVSAAKGEAKKWKAQEERGSYDYNKPMKMQKSHLEGCLCEKCKQRTGDTNGDDTARPATDTQGRPTLGYAGHGNVVAILVNRMQRKAGLTRDEMRNEAAAQEAKNQADASDDPDDLEEGVPGWDATDVDSPQTRKAAKARLKEYDDMHLEDMQKAIYEYISKTKDKEQHRRGQHEVANVARSKSLGGFTQPDYGATETDPSRQARLKRADRSSIKFGQREAARKQQGTPLGRRRLDYESGKEADAEMKRMEANTKPANPKPSEAEEYFKRRLMEDKPQIQSGAAQGADGMGKILPFKQMQKAVYEYINKSKGNPGPGKRGRAAYKDLKDKGLRESVRGGGSRWDEAEKIYEATSAWHTGQPGGVPFKDTGIKPKTEAEHKTTDRAIIKPIPEPDMAQRLKNFKRKKQGTKQLMAFLKQDAPGGDPFPKQPSGTNTGPPIPKQPSGTNTGTGSTDPPKLEPDPEPEAPKDLSQRSGIFSQGRDRHGDKTGSLIGNAVRAAQSLTGSAHGQMQSMKKQVPEWSTPQVETSLHKFLDYNSKNGIRS